METIICFVATDKHPYLEEQVERYKPYFKDVVIMLDKNYDNLEPPYLQIKEMKHTNYSNVLIGMGSIIMDHCEVGSNSIIAAGAVVTQNTMVPPGCIFAGVPAKKIKDIDPHLQKSEIERVAQKYIIYASWFKQ